MSISVLIVGPQAVAPPTPDSLDAEIIVQAVEQPTAEDWNKAASLATGDYLLPLPAGSRLTGAGLAGLVAAIGNRRDAFAYPTQVVTGRDALRLRPAEAWSLAHLLQEPYLPAAILHPRRAYLEVGGWPAQAGRLYHWAYQLRLAGEAGLQGIPVTDVTIFGPSLLSVSPENWDDYLTLRRSLLAALYREAGAWPATNEPVAAEKGMARGRPESQNGTTPGAAGMTLLRYVGGNCGDMPWYGPATGQRYTLGGIHREGYVDNRDVAGMLNIADSGANAFERADSPRSVMAQKPLRLEDMLV